MLNDASETSKAEKATLGLSISTGIIDVSTENSLYNIVRLDECDGGFDGPRRQSFLENITTRLNEINCKNVFCITHNNCFENIFQRKEIKLNKKKIIMDHFPVMLYC